MPSPSSDSRPDPSISPSPKDQLFARHRHHLNSLPLALGILPATLVLVSGTAVALDRTWIGGNVDWVDLGASTNWNPNDEPDSDDRAIFDTANAVNLGSNNTVNGLSLSAGIDLLTNDFVLTVDGLVEVGGASTNLLIDDAAGSINADDLVINADGTVELRGGTLTLDEEVGASIIDVNAGGHLRGNGAIAFADALGVATLQLVNDGEITALSRGLTIFSPPPVGTLQINSPSPSLCRVDLDGGAEAGVVNVNRNQTLDLNVGFQDAFNGTLNLHHESKFDSLNSWTLAGGSIVVDNGFIDGGGFPNTPAGTSYIQGATLTQSGGTINVVDTDGTLQMDAAFTLSGGTFTNAGKVIFNGATNITSAAGYSPADLNARTEINAAMTVTEVGGNFNWDGPGAAATTINGPGSLSLSVNQIDTGDNVFGGVLTLNNGGDLSVGVAGVSWTMGNVLHKNDAATSTVSGDGMIITGTVNTNLGVLNLPTTTTTASTVLTTAGTTNLGAASVFGGGSITGTGTLSLLGTSSVSANTTIGVSTFDWDGTGTGTSHTINSGVTFTINSPTFDSDGDMDDPINLSGSGSTLIVNGPTEWRAITTVNANNAATGTATIGGTSRMILTGGNADLNVNGNTSITAPLTLGATSFVDIDSGFTLDAAGATTYAGVTIDGLGTFSPGTTNTVTLDSTINPDIFDFDGGSWTVESGAELTFNVVDYDTTAVNAFDNTITLNNGGVFANTGDPEMVLDGILNMNASGGNAAEWSGDPVSIGNDAGSLDADLNVTGDGNANSQARFFAPVTFKSDADVLVPAGASLALNDPVAFDTVNAANNAEFTGAGRILFSDVVNVNEAATLNMVGGTVDLDGNDATGEFINIDAPFTINAAILSNFGRTNSGGGVNTLDVNNSGGTGVLTVNLDSPTSEWTLNAQGALILMNDNTDATLLAGSDANLNGTVTVIGDVRSSARLDFGATALVNITTAAQPLRLAGGTEADPNRIEGGTISGVGILGADTGKVLHGFGVINTSVDFDGASRLFADDGVLTINGAILDVETLGTADVDGTLHVPNAWNNNVTGGVQLKGGTFSGGAMTNDTTSGVSGHGLVTARVINNTQLYASLGPALIFQTAGNDNDWDGTTGTGEIEALAANIELRDVGAAFGFTGTVRASNGHRAFANGFALDFNPGSSLILNGGIYHSTNSTDLGGVVTIGGGESSAITVANNNFLTFETGSTTTLNQNLVLNNNNIIIETGATFAGTGALIVPDGSHVVMDNGANANVLVNLAGALRPNNSEGIGQVTVKDLVQAPTTELYMEIAGTLPNQYDRVAVNGVAAVDGYLSLDIDGGFVPALGQTFNIISATGGVTGTFKAIDSSGMPAGLVFKINYLPTIVQVEVISGADYEQWIHLFPTLTNAADRLKTADPDQDGESNLVEFATDGNPARGFSTGKVVGKIGMVGGAKVMTLTFPVKIGPNTAYDGPGPEKLLLGFTAPILHYTVQGSANLASYPLTVDYVSPGADANAIQAGLPMLNVGWTYATCRCPGPVPASGFKRELMRLSIHEGPLPP